MHVSLHSEAVCVKSTGMEKSVNLFQKLKNNIGEAYELNKEKAGDPLLGSMRLEGELF